MSTDDLLARIGERLERERAALVKQLDTVNEAREKAEAGLERLDRHVHHEGDDTGTVDAAIALIADLEHQVKVLEPLRDTLANQLTACEERLSNCFGYPGGPGNPDDCSSCILRMRCAQAIGTEADFQRVCIERDALAHDAMPKPEETP